MARIGLFGGTFNPIHVGHLMIAEEARLAARLDRVIFIPSGESYFKDPAEIAARADRLEMTRRACGGLYEVSDAEIRREGPSYTAVTCREFRRLYPGDELFWILGADSLMEIELWRDPQDLFDSVSLLAFARGGEDAAALARQAAALREKYGADVRLFDAFCLSVSSSDIRRLAAGGHAFRHLVTEPVHQYIVERGLYGRAEIGESGGNDGKAHGL